MIDLALSIVSNPTILAVFAGVGAVIVAFFRGKSSERQKQAARESAALGEQVEMNREGHGIETDVTALTDDEARKEALKWAKR